MESVDVHYRIHGPADAPVLVLAGSLGSDLSMWDAQVQALSDRWRVVVYDHRGHGRSPVPDGPYTVADLGVDLLALLDRLGVRRAHVAGSSLGGMTGMWAAAHAPERISSLVLLCSSAKVGPPDAWRDRAAKVRAEGTAAIAPAIVERWLTPEGADADPERLARLRGMVVATPDEGYAACCEAVAAMDLTDDLPRITAPTLAVAGAQDPAIPPEHAERIAAEIPGARVEILDDAAHLANIERPEAVNELLRHHLEQAEATQASTPGTGGER